jgi:glycosyltransferase involved in cell wall biosynthesis
MQVARDGGIAHLIHYLGYVSDQKLHALYARARALVMMTFFGPTNIPVLEAWAAGCPVITSDIRGIREQCRDAALLAPVRDAAGIADAIEKVWRDDELAARLRAAGAARLRSFSPADFRRRFIDIVTAAAEVPVRQGQDS